MTGTLLSLQVTAGHLAKRSKGKGGKAAPATPARQGGVKRALEDTPVSEGAGGKGAMSSSKKSKSGKAKKSRKEAL
jgi:hypothetical protein